MASKKMTKKPAVAQNKPAAKTTGLSASQKKLPPFIQKAIMKKKGK